MMDNPKNDVDPENDSQDTGKSKKGAYLLLLGLSTLSALAILSLGLIILWGSGAMDSMNWMFELVLMLAAQWLSVIPATLIISSVYKRLSRRKQLYEINPLVRVGLPLLFNILAASSIFLYMF